MVVGWLTRLEVVLGLGDNILDEEARLNDSEFIDDKDRLELVRRKVVRSEILAASMADLGLGVVETVPVALVAVAVDLLLLRVDSCSWVDKMAALCSCSEKS